MLWKQPGNGSRILLCLLAWALLLPGYLPASDSEAWKDLAIEYKEISNSLAAELTIYREEFPKLLELVSGLPMRLNEPLEKLQTSLSESQGLIEELHQPLSALKQQTENLQSSLERQVRRSEVLTYVIIGLVGLSLFDRLLQLR